MLNNRIKVGLIYDGLSLPPKDGVTYRVYHILKRLSHKTDIDAKIYLTDRGWIPYERILQEGFDCKIFPANWLFKTPEKVASILAADQIDIIHVLNSHSLIPFFGFELAKMVGAKLVCDMHDIDHHLYASLGKPPDVIAEAKDIQQLVGDACTHVFAMSSFDIPMLHDMGVASDKITHSPNGVDIYSGVVPSKTCREVLFVGNMTYEPNKEAVEILAKEIIPHILREHRHVQFTMIGRTPDELKSYATGNIHFIGEVDDLTPHLLKADIGVAPLISGSGMKVKMLTYASHALPVLGTPTALMGYEDNNGFIVEKDIPSFTSRLISLLKKPEELSARGEAARDYAQAYFSWDNIVANIVSQYGRIFTDRRKNTFPEIIRDAGKIFVGGKSYALPMFMKEKRFSESSPVQDTCTYLQGAERGTVS